MGAFCFGATRNGCHSANDQETGIEAARLLRILAEQSNELYGPDYARLADLARMASEPDTDFWDEINTLDAKAH